MQSLPCKKHRVYRHIRIIYCQIKSHENIWEIMFILYCESESSLSLLDRQLRGLPGSLDAEIQF